MSMPASRPSRSRRCSWGTAAGPVTLNVALQGATDTAATTTITPSSPSTAARSATPVWDGTADDRLGVPFNSTLLRRRRHDQRQRRLDMGAPYSTFYVESFDLKYQREYEAVNNVLLCRGDSNPVITVSGLTDPQVVVLDISQPGAAQVLAGAAPDVSGRVTFVPRSGTTATWSAA